jgi:DNA-binding PadR family transcriptional regulator
MMTKYRILKLLDQRGEMASRDIIQAIGGLSSTTYAAINTLKYHGYISQRWDVSTDPVVRMFKITDTGIRFLNAAKQVWDMT